MIEKMIINLHMQKNTMGHNKATCNVHITFIKIE